MNKPKVKFIRTHTSSIYRMVDASNPQIQFGVISYEPISGVWQSKSCNPAFDYHINECEDFYDAFWHIVKSFDLFRKNKNGVILCIMDWRTR